MFNLLDDTLKGMLDDASVNAVSPTLYNADVSFITPDKSYAPQQETLNLFLYEARENRELREVTPIVEQVNGMTVTRKPPLRVVCSYMVTRGLRRQVPPRSTPSTISSVRPSTGCHAFQ
jgi:hypothetical protein